DWSHCVVLCGGRDGWLGFGLSRGWSHYVCGSDFSTFEFPDQCKHGLLALLGRGGVVDVGPASEIFPQPGIHHRVQTRVRKSIWQGRVVFAGWLHRTVLTPASMSQSTC